MILSVFSNVFEMNNKLIIFHIQIKLEKCIRCKNINGDKGI